MKSNSNVSPDTGRSEQASAARGLIDNTTEKATKTARTVRRKTAEGQRELARKAGEAKAVTQRAAGNLQRYSRDNPWTVAGIVVAAGFLLSRLLRR